MAKRVLSIVAVVALVLSLTPAGATDRDAKLVEGIASDIEALLGTIEGADLGSFPVKRHPGGFSSISIPIPEDMLTRLRAEKAAGPTFAALAAGLQLSDPGSASTLIMAALSLLSTQYNVWCAVLNVKVDDQTKNTTIQMKGQNKVTGSVTYSAGSIEIVWIEATTPAVPKQVQLICKVASGGKAKSKTFPN